MTATILYPWAALTGIWVAMAAIFVVWWLVVQHRMEQIEHEKIVDLVRQGDRLAQLLQEEAPVKT